MAWRSPFADGPCHVAVVDNSSTHDLGQLSLGGNAAFVDWLGRECTVGVTNDGSITISRDTGWSYGNEYYNITVTPGTPLADSTNIRMSGLFVSSPLPEGAGAYFALGDSSPSQAITVNGDGSCTPDPTESSAVGGGDAGNAQWLMRMRSLMT